MISLSPWMNQVEEERLGQRGMSRSTGVQQGMRSP